MSLHSMRQQSAKLNSEITGHVITPDVPEYGTSRLIFNRAFDYRFRPDGGFGSIIGRNSFQRPWRMR
jgi:hypothetical protein